MSYLLTNASAMTALQNLTMTQNALATTQQELSTGLSIASSKDNTAYWSIATTMNSDNGALNTVNQALTQSASMLSTFNSAHHAGDLGRQRHQGGFGLGLEHRGSQQDFPDPDRHHRPAELSPANRVGRLLQRPELAQRHCERRFQHTGHHHRKPYRRLHQLWRRFLHCDHRKQHQSRFGQRREHHGCHHGHRHSRQCAIGRQLRRQRHQLQPAGNDRGRRRAPGACTWTPPRSRATSPT